MSPAHNGSTALQRFESSNKFAIRNGIMFNFYPGLPHILIVAQFRIQLAMIQPDEDNMLTFPNNNNANNCYTPSYRFWNGVGYSHTSLGIV